METADLKTQIHGLVKIQTFDSQLYALRGEKNSKPQEISVLESGFEAKKADLANAEKVFLDVQKLKKDAELELAGKEEATKKLQTQLYSLKTNKEYQTMLQQINDSKADASLIEDKILELMDRIEKAKTDTEEQKNKLKAQEQIFLQEKKKVEDRIKEIDGRIAQLEAQKKQALPEINPKVLSQYERILASRDGLAIVVVKDDSCGGCNMHLPPQMINLIKMYERIITCEVCNRILYIEGE